MGLQLAGRMQHAKRFSAALYLLGEKKERKNVKKKKKKTNAVKKEGKNEKQNKKQNRCISKRYYNMLSVVDADIFCFCYLESKFLHWQCDIYVSEFNYIFVKTLHLHETICLIFSLKIMIILIFPLSFCEVCLCVLMYYMLQ